jgi:hypothetical protein
LGTAEHLRQLQSAAAATARTPTQHFMLHNLTNISRDTAHHLYHPHKKSVGAV